MIFVEFAPAKHKMCLELHQLGNTDKKKVAVHDDTAAFFLPLCKRHISPLFFFTFVCLCFLLQSTSILGLNFRGSPDGPLDIGSSSNNVFSKSLDKEVHQLQNDLTDDTHHKKGKLNKENVDIASIIDSIDTESDTIPVETVRHNNKLTKNESNSLPEALDLESSASNKLFVSDKTVSPDDILVNNVNEDNGSYENDNLESDILNDEENEDDKDLSEMEYQENTETNSEVKQDEPQRNFNTWLSYVNKNGTFDELLDEEKVSNIHPLRPSLHPLFWKYQFVFILIFMIVIYLLQFSIDFKGRGGKILAYTRISTCLMLGANFRDLGETTLVSAARFLTCTFLHAHIPHLMLNLLSIVIGWLYLSTITTLESSNIWVYHWTIPLFMLTAFLGSLWSYMTTLRHTGFSIGASGGTLGLSVAFLLIAVQLEGVPQYRRTHFIMTVASYILACLPLDSWFSKGSGQRTDIGAHVAGSIAGGCMAIILVQSIPIITPYHLMVIGDICTFVLVGALCLAYIEVVKEYIVDGRELLVRAYVKWICIGDSKFFDGETEPRRRTAPARLRCECLTEEFLFLLENEMIEDDPDIVIDRLNKETGKRRQSLPPLGGCVH